MVFEESVVTASSAAAVATSAIVGLLIWQNRNLAMKIEVANVKIKNYDDVIKEIKDRIQRLEDKVERLRGNN